MPRIYVGTYAKYNNGSIAGKWLDADDYGDKDEFLDACAELHADEDDPEFMFQDFEDIPDGMISESHVDEELWEWLELDDGDRELLSVYRENIDSDGSLESARESFNAKFNSKEDWADQYADDTGVLESVPENLKCYFDFEAFARDCELGGDMTFIDHDGDVWAFSN